MKHEDAEENRDPVGTLIFHGHISTGSQVQLHCILFETERSLNLIAIGILITPQTQCFY